MTSTKKNIALAGACGRQMPLDVFHDSEKTQKPIIIFCHGYKGFKDWGVWDLMAKSFTEKGFFFIKFNFSHNGGTMEDPIDFPDLKAFAFNNYTKELKDLEIVLDWVSSTDFPYADYADTSNISLIGHSRGGGIVIIKASEDKRVKKLITLAAVSDFASRFPRSSELEKWKKDGVAYVENTRTRQQMPHYFQFYEDFKKHEERFTISRAAKDSKIPHLIIHGTEDPTVSVENAKELQRWSRNSEILLIENGNHVFGASHPWEKEQLPEQFEQIVEKSIHFLN
ncbi:MAG TPA: alpha/beta fold hydrolase [Salinimicrobium sp.]|nr:alpha/beta fold hydrolase [Salinimicrobium sp.]